MKIKSLFFALVASYSSYLFPNEYSARNLPEELNFSQQMKAFHERDFFKEIKKESKAIKSCVSDKCTLQEEEEVANTLWAPFITRVNEMSWQCDHAVIPRIINLKDDVEKIKPLVKRVRYCDALNDRFQDYVYKECLKKLNHRRFICNNLQKITEENSRRKSNLRNLSSYK